MTDLSVALSLFGLICCVILVAMLVVNHKPAKMNQDGPEQQASSSSADYDSYDD